jgi:hypothetical protein
MLYIDLVHTLCNLFRLNLCRSCTGLDCTTQGRGSVWLLPGIPAQWWQRPSPRNCLSHQVISCGSGDTNSINKPPAPPLRVAWHCGSPLRYMFNGVTQLIMTKRMCWALIHPGLYCFKINGGYQRVLMPAKPRSNRLPRLAGMEEKTSAEYQVWGIRKNWRNILHFSKTKLNLPIALSR